MKIIRISVLTLLLALGSLIVFAGSPLAQTRFFSACYMNEKVQYAEEKGILDGTLASYLIDPAVPVDQKAAVINALTWGKNGDNNIVAYRMFLARKYGKSHESLNTSELTGDESFCLGYMLMMNDPKDLSKAIALLETAKTSNPHSFTAGIFHSIAVAQNFINNGKLCEGWSVCNSLISDSSLNHDLNAEAEGILIAEIAKYKENCR
jgi:hypothetical protein